MWLHSDQDTLNFEHKMSLETESQVYVLNKKVKEGYFSDLPFIQRNFLESRSEPLKLSK